MAKALLIAGTESGVGKTSISVGLMAALCRRAEIVQPYKVGPDFIDPSHHRFACGRASHNLDGWMLDEEQNRRIFERHLAGVDVGIVEGVMGLFDGYEGSSGRGSTAEMAGWLDLPVVLVVDAWAMARSAAAVVHGFADFEPGVDVCGVIFNRVGGPGHLEILREAVESTSSVRVLGGVPRDGRVEIPERHLGLQMPDADQLGDTYVEALADLIEEHLDLDALVELGARVSPPEEIESDLRAPAVRLGLARDAAFCFYYEENLASLRELGCELVEFSPIDGQLPADLDGLYFGGGYPELFAAELADNAEMIEAVRAFGESGRPVYGECGGLMYLSEAIATEDRKRHQMCGLLPFSVRMCERLTIDYAEVEARPGAGLFPPGEVARGHLFHQSEIAGEAPEGLERAYEVETRHRGAFKEGFRAGSVLASYVHLHFASNPSFAESFVEACGG